ncbi:MAG: hypothetical protein PHC50_02525 [Candidatus Cloacimonetes bacterium]|nr:hypothetical protein [Candidatus Cloacimonadota bacterium]
MKRIYLITVLVIFTTALLANFNLSFTPRTLTVNRFSTFELDPINPLNQPNYTTLHISNLGESTKFDLEVQILWNTTPIIGENALILKSTEVFEAGGQLDYSNQDLVNNSGGIHFSVSGNIDILKAVKKVPKLEEALMAGYFPDGKLSLQVRIRPANTRTWQEPAAVFAFTIKNSSAIHLLAPGARINQVPPKLSNLPLIFNWHSFLADFNEEILVLKEFPPMQIPQSQNVEQAGKEVFRMPAVHSGFSEYLPLNEGCYYAWQVYSPQHTGSNPLADAKNVNNAPRISSPWYVFQYVKSEQEEQQHAELDNLLQFLNNPLIMNLLLAGYSATGEVILDGRVYKGQEALDILESLQGKVLEIEIKD